ncbi:MAG TPA: hypothetical protein VFF52_30630 [Isosphaeraceae bacterium]|nr:hypothetical protein [Isosphaeraceae bacterium]
MPTITNRMRPPALARLLGLLMMGSSCAGCAMMTQDVDAYYRQMAINWQEAADKAKRDAASLENQMKVFAVTGEPAKAQKFQRQVDRIRSWEQHCLKEKVRFEKAAEWTEAHFHLKPPAFVNQESPPRLDERGSRPKPSETEEPSEAR